MIMDMKPKERLQDLIDYYWARLGMAVMLPSKYHSLEDTANSQQAVCKDILTALNRAEMLLGKLDSVDKGYIVLKGDKFELTEKGMKD